MILGMHLPHPGARGTGQPGLDVVAAWAGWAPGEVLGGSGSRVCFKRISVIFCKSVSEVANPDSF